MPDFFRLLDHSLVNPELASSFADRAAESIEDGRPFGSTSEQIVTAIIVGRADWLPDSYKDPILAIERVIAGGASWWHTALYVKLQGVDAFNG